MDEQEAQPAVDPADQTQDTQEVNQTEGGTDESAAEDVSTEPETTTTDDEAPVAEDSGANDAAPVADQNDAG